MFRNYFPSKQRELDHLSGSGHMLIFPGMVTQLLVHTGHASLAKFDEDSYDLRAC